MEFDPKVKPYSCNTPGCDKPAAEFEIGGQTFYAPLCPDCQKAVETEQEAEFQAKVHLNALRYRWTQMGIPKHFLARSFSNFRVNTGNIVAYEACTKYAEEFELGKTRGGIILLGSTGSGKTHLACAILKSVGEGFFINQTALMDDQRATYQRDWENVNGYLDRCLTEPLLVLDDIASENLADGTQLWLNDIMYRISNTRFEEGLPTIVTTNTSMNLFKDRLGPRVTSRLSNQSQRVLIDDIDHRTGC